MDMKSDDLTMELSQGEYLLIYKDGIHEDKKVRGYALAMDRIKVNEWDIMSNPLTQSQIKEVADLIGVEVAKLYDPADARNPGDYDEEQLLKIMANDPSQMRTPIILSKEKSFIVDSPYDLVYDKLATHTVKRDHHENTKNTNEGKKP